MGKGGESQRKGKGEIQLSNDEVLVDDKIYSVESLASAHPGGDIFVKAFAGRDATEAFISYHRKPFPHENQSKFLITSTDNTSKDSEKLKSKDTRDFFELCELVEKVLPKHKAFAPYSYWAKMSVILGCAVGLEAYIHITASYKWYLTAIMGFLMALIGLNIQHDANHGALSKNPSINRFLGLCVYMNVCVRWFFAFINILTIYFVIRPYFVMVGMTQNYIGGSRIDWIHQHVVQHHVATNDLHDDPDMSANEMLRLNPIKPYLKHHFFQHLYTFIIIAGFGVNVTITTLKNLVAWKNYTSISSKLTDLKFFEICTSVLFFMRWIALPLLQIPSVYTILHILPMFIVCGYYLAFFFILSHNFKGTQNFDKHTTNKSFLYRQVASSSNVGGSFLCFLNGGLNYQIEHHLFPRIQHTHYPTIAPIVREFCASRDIPYVHFPTILDNVKSCLDHLYCMGRPV